MPFFDHYPYTNFHNINLDWVLQAVKSWGALVEQNNIAFHNLEEANKNFKNYVTSYLENLNVQKEINNKLDSMLESGVLTEYLQPYISEDVSSWLEENITEPTGVIIDSSLTVAGACADAKVVGERLKQVITDTAKIALLNCFKNIRWVDGNGDSYIETLREALDAPPIPANPFESAVYDFGGWGFSRSSETSTGYLINRNELTKRAGCVVAIPCTSGRLVAKSGYLVTLQPLTSSRMETATVNGQQKQVYIDVIYTESSQYITDTSLDIPSGTQYVCLTLRKENDENFTQNEIDNCYGTLFEYEE